MKNKVTAVISALLISCVTFAQKDELKTLKRLYAKPELSDKDMAEYKAALTQAETYLSSAAEADKVYINFYKAMTPILEYNLVGSKPETQTNPAIALKYINGKNIAVISETLPAVLAYEKKSGKKVYTTDIEETIAAFSPAFRNYAVILGQQNNFKDASNVLYNVYLMDKTKADNLYYAANYAINAKDYDTSLQYYNELKAINYSGEDTVYIARNLANDKDEEYATKAERDHFISLKSHTNPREEKLPSKRGEIYKNIALILVQKGQIEEAKAAITAAKKENPNDTSLLLTEADLYLTLKDMETYKRLISQVLEKSPNDADLVYNLGVVTLQANQLEDSEKYFKRAIEIDPKYINAYINLSAIKLKADKKLVDEMNALGTSEKDNKRYAVLKKERENVFKSALPFLEKAYELEPANDLVIDNLLSVYNYLEMTDNPKYKTLKAAKGK